MITVASATSADLARAEARASALVRYYGISHPDQIVLEDIAFDRGIVIYDGGVIGAESWLLRKGNRGIIRLSGRVRDPSRRRFAIAHELGHWECHFDLSQAWVCTTSDLYGYRGSSPELEANAFASALLMPYDLFRPLMPEDFNIGIIRQLSSAFRTSLMATAQRFVALTPLDCYVVFSDATTGQVRWWKFSHEKPDLYIPSRHVIPVESSAYRCDTIPGEEPGMCEIEPEVWFPRSWNAGRYQIFEDSVVLGGYGVVMTLIWLTAR